jgi:hypothetical protein
LAGKKAFPPVSIEYRGWHVEPDGSIVDEILGGSLLAPAHLFLR